MPAGAYLQFLVNPPPLPTRPGDDSSTIENARTTITLLNAYIDSCTMHIEQSRGERDHALDMQRRATTQSDAAYQALQLATTKNDDLSDSNDDLRQKYDEQRYANVRVQAIHDEMQHSATSISALNADLDTCNKRLVEEVRKAENALKLLGEENDTARRAVDRAAAERTKLQSRLDEADLRSRPANALRAEIATLSEELGNLGTIVSSLRRTISEKNTDLNAN